MTDHVWNQLHKNDLVSSIGARPKLYRVMSGSNQGSIIRLVFLCEQKPNGEEGRPFGSREPSKFDLYRKAAANPILPTTLTNSQREDALKSIKAKRAKYKGWRSGALWLSRQFSKLADWGVK